MLTTTGRLARAIGQIFAGLRTAGRLRGQSRERHHQEIRAWSGRVLDRMGIALHAEGEPPTGPALLVANHVSWLDILALHATCPQARFVSKDAVGRWPLIGRLTRVADTLFIERERRRDAMRVVREITSALQAGGVVAIFPEGTTGPGDRIAPFHANLLQAAVAAGVPVHPVLLHYAEPGLPVSRAAQYLDDTNLVKSALRLARARGVGVHVRYLPAIDPKGLDRRALARLAHARVSAALEQALGGAGAVADARGDPQSPSSTAAVTGGDGGRSPIR